MRRVKALLLVIVICLQIIFLSSPILGRNGISTTTPDFSELTSEIYEESKPLGDNISLTDLADSKYSSLGERKICFTYHFPEPKIEESCARIHGCLPNTRSSRYVSVTMDGLPQYGAAGLPVLPFKTAKILLPFGTNFENVSVIVGKKIPLLGSHLVEYGQEPVPLTTDESSDAPATNLADERVYSSSEPFPGRLYSVVSVQGKMGYKILLLNLYPVEYIPKTGKLFYYESIRVEVEVTSENGGETSVFNGYSQRREIVKSMVDNPEVIETYPTPEQTPIYQYVIITNEELNSTLGPYNLQALMDDKISRGISATIVTVEWIYANYDGTRPDGGEDNQTKIRNFIIDAYNNWGTMYVLLGGDGDGGDVGGESGDAIIPHRGFASVSGEIDYDIPADMYYGCLNGTFDYDGDGLYGEPYDGPSGGEIDLFAEVYVGRACVDSQAEVQNFVYKTLFYQNTTSVNLRKVWMVGEYLGFGGVADWGGNYKDEIKEGSDAHGYTTVGFENSRYAHLFDVSTLYDRDYPGNNWPKSEIIGVINDNVHLINHLGHADVGYVMKMSNPDVDTSLTNNELYFVGYSQGCYCGSFDDRSTTPGSYTSYDCISEHFTTEAHGSVAFISNSRYGWGRGYTTDGPSQHYDREFWDAVLGEYIFNIGIANQDSKEDNAGRLDPLDPDSWVERYCYYEINLFGDPELKIKVPRPFEHELEVAAETPKYLEPGESSVLNATVYNWGLNNETNVELFLLINGTIVNNVTIPELVNGTSYTMDYSWTPTVEAVYNITAYAPPVAGENVTANNLDTKFVRVIYAVMIGIIETHGESLHTEELAYYYTSLGHIVEKIYTTITPEVLDDFDIIIVGEDWADTPWLPSEITAVKAYIDSGRGFVAIGDELAPSVQEILGTYGISYTGIYGTPGSTSNFDHNHPIMQGVSSLYASYPVNSLQITAPAYYIANDATNTHILIAGAEVGGYVLCLSNDFAPYVYNDDNEIMFKNIANWMPVKYEHELAVKLEAPTFLEPGESSLLNATVVNRGLNNETVDLFLLINGTVVNSTTIPELVNGTSYTIDYLWAPTIEAIYNVTVYAPPVPGENITANNWVSEFVGVFETVKAVVLDSWGTDYGYYAFWDYLNTYYETYGSIRIRIDYTSLNKEDITLADIEATRADVLIISDAWYYGYGWEFTDSEIEAIKTYVRSGHGIIATSGTFNTMDGMAPNNRKLADLFGMDPTIGYGWGIWTSGTFDLLMPCHYELWRNISDPYLSDSILTIYPYPSSDWTIQGVTTGWIEALSTDHYAAVITNEFTYKAVYFTGMLEYFGQYNENNRQLFYNAIIWAQLPPYEHELAVSLEAPKFLEPGDPSLLNATVYNGGLNNETNVELFLLINGTVVNNVTIPELVNGTCYTINYSWTPTIEAMYNITAYAPPVPDENVTANNIMSKMVYVRYVEVALISDNSELLAITGILDSMGIVYDIYNDNSIYLYTEDLSLLLKYSAVIFYEYNRLITSSEHSTLQSYLSYGGNLLVTGYDSLGHPDDPLLADVVRSSSYGDNVGEPDLYVVDPSHPIMNGPYGSFPAGYHISGLYSDCDAAEADTARMAVTIAELADGYDKIIATDLTPGKVVFWNGIGPDDWTRNADCEAMFKNTLAWFIIRYEHELFVSLDAQTFLEPGDSTLLNVTVHNRGLSNETDVDLFLLINGTVVNNVTIPELLTGSSYTISYLWTPTVEATYNVTAYAPPVSGENFTMNNIATKIVSVRRVRGHVLFDQTHGTDSITYYGTWVASLTDRAYVVDTHTFGPITPSVLAGYDVFVVPQAHYAYSSSELSAIQDFVSSGGGLLVIGDDDPWIYTDLTGFAGISWTSGGVSGITYDITPHEVTEGVNSVYLDAPIAKMLVTATALDLVRDPTGGIMLAVSELPGRVIGFADEGSLWDYSIGYEDNLQLANNMIDWFIRPEHELVVLLQAPIILEPSHSTLLNATVLNRGLNNEIDVDLFLLINGIVVNSTMIPELVNGTSYTINYLWTPVIEATYNVTAYAPPVPDERAIRNNVVSTSVVVSFMMHILAYVQYADYYEEYANVLRAIKSTFGPAYLVTELWYYTQLDSMLPGNHILLIPEQEYADLFTLFTIGVAWSTTLSNFLKEGGVIILCDYKWGPGGTYGILTGAGLMSISGCNDISWSRVYLVDPSDPLAKGVSRSFIAPYGAVSFVTSESNAVFNDYRPCPTVIHKRIGSGHIVLIGFDYSESNPDADQIIGNAVGLRKHDVAVTSVTALSKVYPTQADITVAVRNEGISIETFEVSAYYDSILIGTLTVRSMAPGAEKTLTFKWKPYLPGYPDYEALAWPYPIYTLSARVSAVPGETDTPDNTLIDGAVTVKWPGDADGDGYIFVYDLYLFGKTWGSKRGGTRYNQQTDFDNDGWVWVQDLYLLARNWYTNLLLPLPNGPTASFTYSPPTPHAYESVKFDARSSLPGFNRTANVPIANYTWNFGDGTVKTITTPIVYYAYRVAGNYTVSLTVTCKDDRILIAKGLTSDTTWQDITILPAPPPIPTVSIYPTKIIGPPPDIDETFTIYINAGNITDLYTYVIGLSWNPTVLECLSWTYNTTFFAPDITIPGYIDNNAGIMDPAYGATLTYPPHEFGITGSGTLADVKFKVVGYGKSWINFTACDMLNSTIWDISRDLINGTFFLPSGAISNLTMDNSMLAFTSGQIEAPPFSLIATPVDKPALLAPWIFLAVAETFAAVSVAVYGKKHKKPITTFPFF